MRVILSRTFDIQDADSQVHVKLPLVEPGWFCAMSHRLINLSCLGVSQIWGLFVIVVYP